MCTLARLVQAEETTDWFGMSHSVVADDLLDVRLTAGPAALEVTVDPAAHGPAALGPIQRDVIVTTVTGERRRFTVLADVLP